MNSDSENKFLEQFSKHTRDEIQKTIDREKLISEVENDLLTNPKYKEFFEMYNQSSIKSFMGHYKYITVFSAPYFHSFKEPIPLYPENPSA